MSAQKQKLTPAKRYARRQVVGMLAYVFLVGVAGHALKGGVFGPLKYCLALLPALPLLGILAAIAAYLLEEDDDFRRMKTTLVVLGGAAIALAVTTAWGFLEAFAGAPHVPLFLVFPLFCLGMLVSSPFVAWKYR